MVLSKKIQMTANKTKDMRPPWFYDKAEIYCVWRKRYWIFWFSFPTPKSIFAIIFISVIFILFRRLVCDTFQDLRRVKTEKSFFYRLLLRRWIADWFFCMVSAIFIVMLNCAAISCRKRIFSSWMKNALVLNQIYEDGSILTATQKERTFKTR